MAVDPITAGIGLVDTFINKFVKDKDLAEKLKAEAKSESFQGDVQLSLGQMAINKVEAAHQNLFVAGWRPFAGWICGIGVAIKFIILPPASWIAVVFFDFPAANLPQFSIAELLGILGGMLGFGAYRTYEKVNGVAREK